MIWIAVRTCCGGIAGIIAGPMVIILDGEVVWSNFCPGEIISLAFPKNLV
jgi:hypothetical protein